MGWGEGCQRSASTELDSLATRSPGAWGFSDELESGYHLQLINYCLLPMKEERETGARWF